VSYRGISVILFLLFLLEGTLLQYVNTDYYGSSISIYPRFVLVFLLFISIFFGKKRALVYGFIFGLLYDIIFGRTIGLYMIGMAGIGYFGGWLIQFFHPTFSLYLMVQLIGHLSFEFYLYGMLRLYQIVHLPLDWALTHMIIPSIMLNLLFAIFIYPLSFVLIEKNGLRE